METSAEQQGDGATEPPADAKDSLQAMIRILIADRHEVVRRGLKSTFAQTPLLTVEAEARTGAAVLARISSRIDLVVMELAWPDRSGLDLLQEIKRRRPSLPVVVYTAYSEDEFAVRCLQAGASAYLTKSDSLTELIGAARSVVDGARYLTRPVANRLALHLDSTRDTPPHETLSNREYQVMRALAKGEPLKAIAQHLCLSPKTISTYRHRVLRKMRMKTNADLTRYMVSLGMEQGNPGLDASQY